MKELIIDNINDHLMILSDEELRVLEALTFYFATTGQEDAGMTKKAYAITQNMLKKLQKMNMGNFQVWE